VREARGRLADADELLGALGCLSELTDRAARRAVALRRLDHGSVRVRVRVRVRIRVRVRVRVRGMPRSRQR